jgi:hypothetical protein
MYLNDINSCQRIDTFDITYAIFRKEPVETIVVHLVMQVFYLIQ